MNRGSTRMNRGRPGTTGDNRGSTGKTQGRTCNDWSGTGNNRDGTVNNQDVTSYDNAPLRYISKPALCRDATAFTGAPPEHYRRRPVLNRGVACRRCYGIPGLCRDAAGFHWSSTGVDRDSAGLLTGFNWGG
ncbi:hypothetical protein DPMN_059479 [Dreissena polymorpha]|uniref:Uncharacterized protein n=1 Tax=Dreissena polymorpha TaxID=45954 RepID=A0A9D4HF08_DREPO|nr:hypothetical protein DPMN_059479 [Dreissena polymorpha]